MEKHNRDTPEKKGVGPEASQEKLNEETEKVGFEEAEKALETATERAKSEEARILEQTNAAVEKAGTSLGVDANEAKLVLHGGGFAARIDTLKKQIREVSKGFEDKVADLRVNIAVRQAAFNPLEKKPVINWYYGKDKLDKLAATLATLTDEQVARQNDLLEQTRTQIKNALEHSSIYEPEQTSKSLEGVDKLYTAHPAIAKALYEEPGIVVKQKELLLQNLRDPSFQSRARKYSDALHIPLERAQGYVTDILERQITLPRYSDERRTRVTDAVEQFGLSPEVTRSLAYRNFMAVLASDYPFITVREAAAQYKVPPEMFEQTIQEHEAEVVEAMNKAALKRLADGEPQVVDNFINQWEGRFITQDSFKQYVAEPERQRQVILGMAGRGGLPGEYDFGHYLLRYIPQESIAETLATPEGRAALYTGAQRKIQEVNLTTLENYVRQYGLDMDQIRQDPRTLASMEEYLGRYIGANHQYWPTEKLRGLGIEDDQFRSWKVSAIGKAFEDRQLSSATELLTGMELTDEEKRSISTSLFRKVDRFGYLERVLNLPPTTGDAVKQVLLEEHERLHALSDSTFETYVVTMTRIDESPSQEIQRLKPQLLGQLVEAPEPEKAFKRIEDIFIKNNVPVVGKVFGVFETLYPASRIKTHDKNRISPVLKNGSSRRRYATIYSDLLNVHIDSGNRSLRDYAQTLQSGAKVLSKYEAQGSSALSPREQKQLRSFLGKMETLRAKSALGPDEPSEAMVGTDEVASRIDTLRASLKVGQDQSILERVEQMYLRPAGLSSLDELLTRMAQTKAAADKRGRDAVMGAVEGGPSGLSLQEGDFLKGVQAEYIGNILQNGSVAKEYLGASAQTDATPFDTDVSLVREQDTANGFSGAIQHSLATSYGELLLAFKERGQFYHSEEGEKANGAKGGYEVFQTGGEQHYGIRTGMPSSEIDFMIAGRGLTGPMRRVAEFEIAQNGFYIPIVDESGRLLYSPERFDELRKSFAGIDRFQGGKLEVLPVPPGARSHARIEALKQTMRGDRERIKELSDDIRTQLAQTLDEMRIPLRGEFDDGILGAELADTGSTGRHTNVPGDADFDLSLKLDANDFKRSADVIQKVQRLFSFAGNDSHSEDGYYQMRLKGVSRIGKRTLDAPIDIDIGFGSKADVAVYGTHDAIRDRLEHIRSANGEATYESVLANIVHAKEVLKHGHAYKKFEDGGMGGVGVENWVLANGGNAEQAFATFMQAAFENGAQVSLERFRERYSIIDPGVNIKYGAHDDFARILKENGYEAMIAAIAAYRELG